MAGMSKKQKEKLVYQFDDACKSIQEALSSLKESIDELQNKGDKPLWNGKNACEMIQTISSQINDDSELLEDLCQVQKKIKI